MACSDGWRIARSSMSAQKVAEKDIPSEGENPGDGFGMRSGCDWRQPGPIVRHVPGLSQPMNSLTGSRKKASIWPMNGVPSIS